MVNNIKPNYQSRQINWIIRDKYQGKITPEFKKDLQKLQKSVPLDYIIGFSQFINCRIDLSLKPLIPRPETEYWVDYVIKEIQILPIKKKRKLEILDIFSGSGCIGIAILKNISHAKVDFADNSTKLIRQIKLNLSINQIPSPRFRLIKSDIFNKISSQYDYILANPPYMPEEKPQQVCQSVRQFEPQKAVFAADKGLYYLQKLLIHSPQHLKKNGKIYLEFHHPQKRQLQKILKKSSFASWQFYRDQYGFWRYLSASLIS